MNREAFPYIQGLHVAARKIPTHIGKINLYTNHNRSQVGYEYIKALNENKLLNNKTITFSRDSHTSDSVLLDNNNTIHHEKKVSNQDVTFAGSTFRFLVVSISTQTVHKFKSLGDGSHSVVEIQNFPGNLTR